jgi:peptidoglycan/LPS O-acetylase OafA/YrhL
VINVTKGISEINSLKREVNIDTLRGLSILGVISVHVAQHTNSRVPGLESIFFKIASMGRYGVELFFLVSGYLLFKIYGVQKGSLGKKYFLRRLARIYPLWVIFLVLNILTDRLFFQSRQLEPLIGSSDSIFPMLKSLLLGLTFLLFLYPGLWNDVVPGGWSIQAEIAHYIAFPLIRRFGLGRTLFILLLLNIWTIVLASDAKNLDGSFTYSSESNLTSIWLRTGIYSTFSFFIYGGLLYLFILKRDELLLTKYISTHKVISALLILHFISVVLLPCPFGATYQALAFIVISLIVVKCTSRFGFFQEIVGRIGFYSYFIYFSHFFFLKLYDRLFYSGFHKPSGLLAYAILYLTTLLSCFYLSKFSMKYLERPIMRLAR